MALLRSSMPSSRKAERSTPAAASAATPGPAKKKVTAGAAWREARLLIHAHRGRLALGLGLMLVSRLAGLVLPASAKYVIDDVIGKGRHDLLMPIALAGGAATIVQAASSFGLSQILGVAAQRAITDMRKRVQAKVMRLPVRYFDSTQTGILVSRIMSDADGLRNLVGTGLVQLVGGLVTATIGLGVLLYLNWRLTIVTMIVLGLFGGGMAYAFKTLRPLFRERGKISAEVTGRLTEALGGIRVVKSYTAEKREEIVFTHGAHRLFRNIAQSMTGVSATTAGSTVIIGAVGVLMVWLGGNDILAGRMTLGDFVMYIFFIGLVAAPLVSIASIGTQITEAFAGLDRIREILDMHTEDELDADNAAMPAIHGDVEFDDVSFEYHPGQPVLKHVTFARRSGLDHGAGRLERLGQEHAHQPGDGVQPAVVGAGAGRRPGSDHGQAARVPPAGGVGAAGEFPLRRHDRRQHRLRQPAGDARAGRGGVPPGALRGVHPALPGGLRHRGRRARHQALGRPAAARVDRPGAAGRAAHPHPRRGHLVARQRERGDDPGRAQAAAPGPHHLRHRPPAVDHPQRRPDPGARGRRDRRARQPRRAAGARRAATATCTTSSTRSRPTASSTPARTGRRSCRGRWR